MHKLQKGEHFSSCQFSLLLTVYATQLVEVFDILAKWSTKQQIN